MAATATAPTRKRRSRKNKYITLHSPFLMKETKHELIGDPIESSNGRRQQWARCTRTHHSQLVDLDELEARTNNKEEDVIISREHAVSYNPRHEYSIGDTIAHDVWNTVGRVIRKEITSNGSHAIVVQFEDRTEKRLIEKLSA